VKRVVLVRTMGPRNAGMVMRAVANFAPAELWLVAPVRPSLLIHPEFTQMSHGVENIRNRIHTVATLPEALTDCTRSIGFTARARDNRTRVDWREVSDTWADYCCDPTERVALVFGSEENGLTSEESDALGELSYLATSAEHTSLNLAMAVTLVLSGTFRGSGSHVAEAGARLIDGATLDYLKRHLKHVLAGRVARGAATKADIEASIERVFSRAPIESRDARAWHKVLRALGSNMTPPDFGLQGTQRRARRSEALDRTQRRRADGTGAPPGE
jgi:TrmH family RNA methyltransferase